MVKSKKNPSLSSTKIFGILGVFIVTLFAALGITNLRANQTETSRSQSLHQNCGSVSQYEDLLQHSGMKLVNIGIQPDNNLGMLLWKREASEPFIEYPSKFQVNGFSSDSAKEINDQNISQIEKSFLASGFTKSTLNTGLPGENFTRDWEYQYGYKRGDERVVVTVHDGNFGSQNTGNVEISCAITVPVYDTFYNEFLTSKDLIDLVAKEKGPRGMQAMIFGIFEKHQNNIMTLGEASTDWMSGSAVWTAKKDGHWIIFHVGQDLIDCNLIEKYGIEPGVSCMDSKNPSHDMSR